MPKKLLSLFAAIAMCLFVFICYARAEVKILKNEQYINVIGLTWTHGPKDLEKLMNLHYDKPKGVEWKLETSNNTTYTPYYIVKNVKFILPVTFIFENNKLISLKTSYPKKAHPYLVKRVKDDFYSGGYLETQTYIHYIYEKEMKRRKCKLTIEMVYYKQKEYITFEASYKRTRGEMKNERSNERSIADVYSASHCSNVGNHLFRLYIGSI
jgi:hypothetical protein